MQLNDERDRQSLVVQAEYADGLTRDVTALAKISLANPRWSRIDKATLYPTADGKTELTVEFAGIKQVVFPSRWRRRPPIGRSASGST